MTAVRGVLVFLLLGAAFVAGEAVAAVAAVAPALLQPLSWRSIGPFRGGRVLTVSGVPGEPSHFYFGAVNGGVWETVDAGRTWTPIFDAAGVGSIGALAVAPSDPRVLYVGTGEPDMRSNIAEGEGVFRSSDAGRTWQRAGLEDSRQIGRILVDPKNPDVLLVAALGHPYGSNDVRGVFRSTDGGRSWRRTLYKDADTGAIDLAAEPGSLTVVYASLWQTRRPPWNVYPPSSGPGSGLYKSLDGGQTWAPLTGHGLPARSGRIGLAIAPSAAARVFALVDAKDGGLYRSEDGGEHFVRVSDDKRLWGRGWYFAGVTVDPADPEIVYVCNTAVYRSSDGGRTFVPIKGAPGGDDYHQLWIDPANPARRALAVDQGALVTLDGGATWSSWFNQPIGQFYHVVTDNRFPYWVYGAQQDSGAAGVPSRTGSIDGINMTHFRELAPGGESDNIAPDPDDPETVFGGRVDRVDLRTGVTQSIDPTLAHPDIYRATWTLPLVFAKSGAHALYFGNQRIFRSSDRGQHWDVISPDLSRENPELPANLDATTVEDHENAGMRRGVVYAIGPSPLSEHLLWAGTDDGLVWRTRDGGAHWQNVTPAALRAWSKVAAVEPSHFSADSAYIAVDRHRLDDPRPYIYRTHDGGTTWSAIADGIADGGAVNSVNVVREDPAHRGLLYAGTERGVYVSFDDGDHWQPLQQNLPRTSVRDLEVHGADLVIATHGRGLWIMDNVAPLRAYADDAGAATRLLPPAPAVRVRAEGFTGSPMPKDEPMAANPPAGASIDYVLGTVEAPVTLTISDATGAVVRSFSSATAATAADTAKLRIAPEWVAPAARLAADPGAHRFVWNLAYPPAALEPDAEDDEAATGIWVPPGDYQVELAAGGASYRQTLRVLPDPRSKLSQAGYARQFALSRDIERARLEVAKAGSDAERVHAALVARARGAGPALAATLQAAERRVATLADLSPDKPTPDSTGAAPRTVDGLRYLEGAFRKLASAVGGSDSAPSADAEKGFLRHRQLLDGALAAWAHFKAGELVAINAALTANGAEAIAP